MMIEPGLLRIFRGYSFLRLALGLGVLALELFGPDNAHFGEPAGQDSLNAILVALVLMLVLVAYLYAPRLEKRLGKFYIPLAIGMATLSLFLEQYLLTPRSLVWQSDSFFFILLIFVSWQYDMRAVALFSVGVAGADILLDHLLRPTLFILSRVAPPDGAANTLISRGDVFFFGRQTGRLVSFLILGFVITSLVNAQRKQRQELAQANRALVQHSNTLEQLATSRERNRLSRELHDTVAHTLSGLTVQLEALQTAWKNMPAKAVQMVETMLSTTRGGLDETRRTLKNLRATPLEELGLNLAIEALAADASGRKSLKLKTQITRREVELPPDVEQAFYRVAQEALENVVRHAQAKNVSLALRKRKGQLELVVKDDGEGFALDKMQNSERLGLTLMKERAELVGATFHVESKPAQGTTVRMVY